MGDRTHKADIGNLHRFLDEKEEILDLAEAKRKAYGRDEDGTEIESPLRMAGNRSRAADRQSEWNYEVDKKRVPEYATAHHEGYYQGLLDAITDSSELDEKSGPFSGLERYNDEEEQQLLRRLNEANAHPAESKRMREHWKVRGKKDLYDSPNYQYGSWFEKQWNQNKWVKGVRNVLTAALHEVHCTPEFAVTNKDWKWKERARVR